MILFEKQIQEVKKMILNGKTKEEICNECLFKQGNVRLCFRCPAVYFENSQTLQEE
jgi:hypothetical protein